MTCAAAAPILCLLLVCVRDSASLFLPDSEELRQLLSRYEEDAAHNGTDDAAGSRTRRAIRWSDRDEILQLHNKLRGSVYPSAANMEHMVRRGIRLMGRKIKLKCQRNRRFETRRGCKIPVKVMFGQ